MSSGVKIHLSFEVGDAERHHVEFDFNQFWGGLSIKVDGVSVRRDLRFFSVNLVKSYGFTVGTVEQHDVLIQKTRADIFPGFRPQAVRAFVDGQLVAQDQSLASDLGTPTTP